VLGDNCKEIVRTFERWRERCGLQRSRFLSCFAPRMQGLLQPLSSPSLHPIVCRADSGSCVRTVRTGKVLPIELASSKVRTASI